MPSACNLAQEAGEHLGHGSSQGTGILRADYGAAHAVDAAVGIGGVGSVCRDCANRAFGGADTCATSTTIAAGIRKVGDVDVIFAGRQAIDGDTAQVGPQVAQRLGLPVVTYVQDIQMGDGKAVVQRQLEDGYEIIEVQTPCLLTAVKELNQPRYMSIGGIVDAYKKEITVWDHNAVELDPKDCGLNASPTQVFRSFTPPQKGKGEMLSGTIQEMSAVLVDKLREKHYI